MNKWIPQIWFSVSEGIQSNVLLDSLKIPCSSYRFKMSRLFSPQWREAKETLPLSLFSPVRRGILGKRSIQIVFLVRVIASPFLMMYWSRTTKLRYNTWPRNKLQNNMKETKYLLYWKVINYYWKRDRENSFVQW